MKKSIAAACLVLLAHSLPCRAEEAGSLPAPIVAVSTILQLSPDQLHALLTMVEARETAVRPLAEELQRHQQAIEQLLSRPDADAATVGRLVLETRALTANIAVIRGQAAAQFAQILTPDQLETLQHIREAAAISDIIPPFRAAGLV